MTFALYACILLLAVASTATAKFRLPTMYLAGVAGAATAWAGWYILEATLLMNGIRAADNHPTLGVGVFLAAGCGLLILVVCVLAGRRE